MGHEAFPFRATPASRAYDSIRRLPVRAALENVRSLYNVGSFFRTGDAAGLECLHLCGYTARPPHRGISKTALGAESSLPWRGHDSARDAIEELRATGFEIAVVETSPRAVDLYDWRPRFPTALIFGNEVEGVSRQVAEAADSLVRVPTLGRKQSLNVAVAGGAVLFELLRKYRALQEDADRSCESLSTRAR